MKNLWAKSLYIYKKQKLLKLTAFEDMQHFFYLFLHKDCVIFSLLTRIFIIARKIHVSLESSFLQVIKLKKNNLPIETKAKEVTDVNQLHHPKFSPVLVQPPNRASFSSFAGNQVFWKQLFQFFMQKYISTLPSETTANVRWCMGAVLTLYWRIKLSPSPFSDDKLVAWKGSDNFLFFWLTFACETTFAENVHTYCTRSYAKGCPLLSHPSLCNTCLLSSTPAV